MPAAAVLDPVATAPPGLAAAPGWRERLALLLECGSEGLVGVDLDGRCSIANRAAAALLGHAPQALLGRDLHALIHHSLEDGSPCDAADCPLAEALREGRPGRIDDAVLWRADGTSFWAECAGQPLVEDGRAVGAVLSFRDVGERRRAEFVASRARQQIEQLRELAAHQDRVRETERGRLAHAIHDELGSLLVALKMDVGWLGKRLDERSELQDKCQGMGRLIGAAVDHAGRIINALRPAILDHQGLWAALEWQVQAFTEGEGRALRVDLGIHVARGVRAPDGTLAIAVFRILEELLSNVARHAQARRLEIRISVDDPPAPVLYVEVCDDGVGAWPAALNGPHSHGVLGMRERAAHFGGRLSIDSTPGAGTRARLVMPLPD